MLFVEKKGAFIRERACTTSEITPRKLKEGIGSLFDHRINTIAATAILSVTYGG